MRSRFIKKKFKVQPGAALLAVLFALSALWSGAMVAKSTGKEDIHGNPVISKLKPEQARGRGYKLVYTVDAPPAVVWKFKTDFENELLLSNRYIRSHRLVSRDHTGATTETVYSNKPKNIFKWQSTVFPDRYLLKYVLLNPADCGQKYHYGSIQLEADDFGTRVTQVAYFNFFGVSFWVNYPFAGGMSHFLSYTARWEQQTIAEYRFNYEE